MSRIHVLLTEAGSTHGVTHQPVPAGNNAIGQSWQAVGLASGRTGNSSMPVGTELGRITQEELDTIVDGTVVEIPFTAQADSGGTSVAQRLATLNSAVARAVADWTDDFKVVLKFYGYTAP